MYSYEKSIRWTNGEGVRGEETGLEKPIDFRDQVSRNAFKSREYLNATIVSRGTNVAPSMPSFLEESGWNRQDFFTFIFDDLYGNFEASYVQ